MPPVDLVAIGLCHGGAALHDAGELFRVQAGQCVRVLRLNEDPHRQILRHLAELFFFPGQSLGEDGLLGIAVVQPVLSVGKPVQIDFFRSGELGFSR